MSEIKELTNQIKAITRNISTRNASNYFAMKLDDAYRDLKRGEYANARGILFRTAAHAEFLAAEFNHICETVDDGEYDNARIMIDSLKLQI